MVAIALPPSSAQATGTANSQETLTPTSTPAAERADSASAAELGGERISMSRGDALLATGDARTSQDFVTSQPSRFSFAALGDAAVHAFRSVTSSDYRHAMERDVQLATLRGSADTEVKIAAASALRSLVRDGESGTLTSGASVQEAVAELKLVVGNPENTWELRSTALTALGEHYTKGGKLEAGFARDMARALIGEKETGMCLSLASMLGQSREPFVREVLLETLKDERTIVVAEAGAALKVSLGARPPADIEAKLLNKVSGEEFLDKTQHVHERLAALTALSGHRSEVLRGIVAAIIQDPNESPQLRFKTLEFFGADNDRNIRNSILVLASQDESSKRYPSLLDVARHLAGKNDPGMVIETENLKRVRLGDWARSSI